MRHRGLSAYTLFSLASAAAVASGIPAQELVPDLKDNTLPPSKFSMQPRTVATVAPTPAVALQQEIAKHNRQIDEARRQKKLAKAQRKKSCT